MKFFIDTANLSKIAEAQVLGILDGVITNPSLIAKEGKTGADNILKHYLAICNIIEGDTVFYKWLSIYVWACIVNNYRKLYVKAYKKYLVNYFSLNPIQVLSGLNSYMLLNKIDSWLLC